VPIYDYLCSSCGARTEVIHGIAAPGPRYCPACGADGTLRKAFAPPAVHFKGSGWAKKDRSATISKPSSKPETGDASAKPGASGGDESPSGAAPSKPPSSTSGNSKSAASSDAASS
jgi:putative FmdB family regulatory protein